MKAFMFRMLATQFNAALDDGRHDDLTVEEVKRHARAGAISNFVTDRFKEVTGLSWMESEDWAVVDEEWQTFANTMDKGRKMGLENKGLCLLLGYALESGETRARQELKDQQKAPEDRTPSCRAGPASARPAPSRGPLREHGE